MFHKTFHIANSEARMSSRGWRFWLLLVLMGGISYFARGDYLNLRSEGFFLHTAYSFQHPSFWLMLAVIYLGAVFLALDTCGRVRRTGVDKILFPLPVGSMELIWGQFLGVLIMVIPLSAFGFFSLGIWQAVYSHGFVVWQPFVAAYGILVLPVILPLAAITITMRTCFKHDFAALLAGCLFTAGLVMLGNKLGVLLDLNEIIDHLVNASPTIGVRLAFGRYAARIAAHCVLGITILYCAPLYLRRQDLQQWVSARGNRFGLLNLPTLRRWISTLRFDSHLGWGYRLALVIWLIGCTTGGIWATYRYQETIAKKNEWKRLSKTFQGEEVAQPTVDILRYTLDAVPSLSFDHIDFAAKIDFRTLQETNKLAFELDPFLVVKSVDMGNQTCHYTQRLELLKIALQTPIPVNEERSLTIHYHGDCSTLYPSYSFLEDKWYPQLWIKWQTQGENRWVSIQEDLFEAEIHLHIQPGQTGAFAGELVSAEDRDGKRIERWRTIYPVNTLQMYWGKYSYIDKEKSGYRIRFYHLPKHEYQAQVYMEEIKEQEDYVVDKLGQVPFPQLTLIEIPYEKPLEKQGSDWRYGMWGRWRGSAAAQKQRECMPGLMRIAENQLVYLNERMWLIERLDHDPRTIPFYQQIRPTLNFLHEQFYDSLISVYFDQTLHPTGDLAFWLRDDLSGYASKLLEQNPWKRKNELLYEIGTRPELPSRVAREQNLLTLHKDGKFPSLERVRGEGLVRLIHHLLKDDLWWKLMREIFREYRFRELPVDEFLKKVQDYYGKDLTWFADDWINGTALPEYEITQADAKIIENKQENKINYEIVIMVKNHGSGRMSVPIFIETEADYIFRDLWLDSEGEGALKLTAPNRPIYAVVDPEQWVVQQPYYDPDKKVRNRSEKRIYIVGEEGMKDRSSSGMRKGQRNRGFGGGMHFHF